MSKEITRTIYVCLDCMLVRENDEAPIAPDREPWNRYPNEDVTANFGDDADEHFYTISCEACGSELAGARFEYAVWEEM